MPERSQPVRLLHQALERLDTAETKLRAAKRLHDKRLTEAKDELQDIWDNHADELLGPDRGWIYHHINNTLGVFGGDIEAKIDDMTKIPADWECPGCGRHDCPGCSGPNGTQTLSCFV